MIRTPSSLIISFSVHGGRIISKRQIYSELYRSKQLRFDLDESLSSPNMFDSLSSPLVTKPNNPSLSKLDDSRRLSLDLGNERWTAKIYPTPPFHRFSNSNTRISLRLYPWKHHHRSRRKGWYRNHTFPTHPGSLPHFQPRRSTIKALVIYK